MKQLILVTADDEKLGNVIVSQVHLAKAEKLLNGGGLGESTMSPTAHHFLCGGVAYLLSHPKAPLTDKEMVQYIKKNKSALRAVAKSVNVNEHWDPKEAKD